MAEVLAVVGALSSFLQVIECTAKVISYATELATSTEDALKDNVDLERLGLQYKSLGESMSGTFQEDEPDFIVQVRTAEAMKQKRAMDDETKRVSSLGEECQKEGDKLLTMLADLKIDPKASRVERVTRGARQAVRSLTKKKHIERRRQNLHELNCLLATSRLKVLVLRQELSSASPSDPNMPGDFTPGTSATGNEKLALELAARYRIRHLLSRLHFPEMLSRSNAIAESYPDTYRWALDTDEHGLRSWLRDGTGIFWISGKPGSGKSTLMKFISGCNITTELLRCWAGGSEVMHAAFYFWFLGTSTQKSISGLLRSLLYQILCAHPDLAEIAIPDHHRYRSEMQSDEFLDCPWNQKDLIVALQNISQNRQRLPKKLCLFIDGLDEYNGFELEIIRLIEELSKGPDIKVCVSSRPWNSFRKAFETSTPNLRLEDVTRSDIRNYSAGRMRVYRPSESDEQEIDELVEDIVDKAEGVFLWVQLVVDSMIQGFAEGDSIRFLRHRVQQYPPDLEDFFRNILGRVHYSYRQRTHQALKLAWIFASGASSNTGVGLQDLTSVTDYWLMSRDPSGLADPRFAFDLEVQRAWNDFEDLKTKVHGAFDDHSGDEDLQDGEPADQATRDGDREKDEHLEGLTKQQVIEETRTFLSAATKDLLCVYANTFRVEFLHRTVYEFLNTDALQSLLNKDIPDIYLNQRILHLLNLARMKIIIPGEASEQIARTASFAANMSIVSRHEDWSPVYIGLFHDALYPYISPNRLWTHHLKNPDFGRFDDPLWTGVLEEFVALGRAECASVYLDNRKRVVTSIYAASLGEFPARRFDLENVNTESLKKLVSVAGRVHIFGFDDIWSIFLRKWTGSESPICESCEGPSSCPRILRSRKVWEVAKVILDATFWRENLRESLFLGKKLAPFLHAEYLRQHIPREWLLEPKIFP